jgi:hypothetical protein
MEHYYKVNDWERLTLKDPSTISIKGHRVPYAAFENLPEKTHDPATLGKELERATSILWRNWSK